jgi:hypothetical protein
MTSADYEPKAVENAWKQANEPKFEMTELFEDILTDKKFISLENLSVFALTFNVNAKV